jgi:hypothetical protein
MENLTVSQKITAGYYEPSTKVAYKLIGARLQDEVDKRLIDENFVGTKAQIQEREVAIKDIIANEFEEAKAKYNSESRDKDAQLTIDIQKELGINLEVPVVSKFWYKSYEQGHSSGWDEVYTIFEGYISILKEAGVPVN